MIKFCRNKVENSHRTQRVNLSGQVSFVEMVGARTYHPIVYIYIYIYGSHCDEGVKDSDCFMCSLSSIFG